MPTGIYHTIETKKKMSEIKKGTLNPFFGKKHSIETKRKISEASKKSICSEETKKKISESRKGEKHWMFGKQLSQNHKNKLSEISMGSKNHFYGKHHSEETKKKISEAKKGKSSWSKGKINIFSVETLQKMSNAKKGKPAWNKGLKNVQIGSMKGKKHSEETKNKISELAKKRICKIAGWNKGIPTSQETKEKLRQYKGEKSCHWQGGKSFESYGLDWTQTLKRSIRERDKYVCQICNMPQGDKAYHIHHIDYNKKNNNPDNLITLCQSCHMKTNYNREHWENYFSGEQP